MRQAEINRLICALQTQSEKYWEESGYKDEEKRLQEFGLNKDRFITIQRGVNPFSGTIEAPKMWPVEHFNTLIK